MVDIYRMVRRLCKPVDYLYPAPGNGGGGKYCKCKVLPVDSLRAAVRKDYPSGGHFFYGCRIQPLVGSQCIVYGISVLCESRRVYNDKVVLALFRLVQIIYRIATE